MEAMNESERTMTTNGSLGVSVGRGAEVAGQWDKAEWREIVKKSATQKASMKEALRDG